jgi:hypothetical protein
MKTFYGGLIGAVLIPLTAHAQIAVTDPGNLVAQAKNLLQELKSYGTQLQQYETEVQQAATLVNTANSLIQHPSLGGVESLMGQAGFNVTGTLPINPYAVMSLTSGFSGTGLNGIMSKVSGLGSLVNAAGSINHVYTCTGATFACQQQQQQAAANAGLQGIVGKIYGDFTNHLAITQGLRANLATSTDPAQRENVIAQLGAEQVWAQSASAQMQAATTLYEAQRQANIDRENEHMTQNGDAVLASMPK